MSPLEDAHPKVAWNCVNFPKDTHFCSSLDKLSMTSDKIKIMKMFQTRQFVLNYNKHLPVTKNDDVFIAKWLEA